MSSELSPVFSSRLPTELWAPPTTIGRPPVAPRVQVLPLLEIGWENFEKLCLKVASILDGLEDPRLFGERGQRQDGIDFWGLIARKPAVYQARRLDAEPSAALLRNAFLKFKAEGSELASRRFTLCTARSAANTGLQKELARLRQENADYTIDVYDEHRLTELLRRQPDIVFQFFGPGWPESFCGMQPSFLDPGPGQPAPLELTEAALLGPIRSLGLAEELERADQAADAGRRAELLSGIALRLRERGFRGHADRLDERRAEALFDSGQSDEAFAIWLDLAIVDIERGSSIVAPTAMHRMRDAAAGVRPELQMRHLSVVSRAQWGDQSQPALDQLRRAFLELDSAGSSGAGLAGVWLGECALVDKRFDVIDDLVGRLERHTRLLDSASSTRLQLILAEHLGEFAAIARLAETGQLGAADGGLVLCRYGRWLAWDGQPEDARDAYRKAIPMLVRADLLGDASDALSSITAVLSRYGPVEEITDTHAMARAFGGRHRFRTGDPLRSALESVRESKLADAHGHLREFLRQVTLSGHLWLEFHAREVLADVLARAGERHAAMGNYVLAGEKDRAAELAGALEVPIDVELQQDERSPWSLATRLAVLAANGDLVATDTARAVIPALLRYRDGIRQSPFGPRVSTEADNAIAGLSFQVSREQMDTLLDVYEPLIARGAATWRPIDLAIIQTLLAAYRVHPDLADRAFNGLLRCLGQSHIGNEAVNVVAGLATERSDLRLRLVEVAESGNAEAVVALCIAGVRHQLVREQAMRRYERVMRTKPPVPGREVSLVESFEIDAVFARQLPARERERLARRLLTIANHPASVAPHRLSALVGLSNLAGKLRPDVRASLFADVLDPRMAKTAASELDQILASGLHPLSRIRIDLGADELSLERVVTAAALCTNAASGEVIGKALVRFLYAPDVRVIRRAIRTLGRMDSETRPRIDLAGFAYHPDPAVRGELATHLCQLQEPPVELIERLAGEGNRKVRVAVALNLWRILRSHREAVSRMRASLASDPSAHVRVAAAGLLDPPTR